MSKKFGIKLTKQNVMDNITKYISAVFIVVLLALLTATQPNFLGTYNLKNLLRDPAPLMLMASGMGMVLLLGSIDLSMGAVCSVTNVMYLKLMMTFSDSFSNTILLSVLCMGVCLLFGCLSGLMLGIIHVKLKVPSFIASLGFMSVWQSLSLLISEAPVGIPKVLWPAVEWYKVTVFGVVGLPLIVSLVILILVWCMTRFTSFGKAIYAIGGNERTARVAGLDVDKNKIIVFVLAGMLAALAGIFLVANLRSSSPTIGDPYTMQIVASCALGGIALSGGKGSILGAILGVFTVALINNGMTYVGIDAYWQNVVFGAFVLGAIALTVDRKTRGLAVK